MKFQQIFMKIQEIPSKFGKFTEIFQNDAKYSEISVKINTKWRVIETLERNCTLRHWREIARGLEHRWRERTQKLRHAADAPQNPADAQDDEHAAEIDAVMQQILPNDIRYYGNERQ